MENPLRKYQNVKVLIIWPGEWPSRTLMWCNCADNMAWRLWETLDGKENYFVIAGDELLSQNDIERIKTIGKQYYEQHKAEIDG